MLRQEDIFSLRREKKMLMCCLETIPITKEQQRLLNARKFPPTCKNMHGLRMLHEEMAAKYESFGGFGETDPAIVEKCEKLTSYTTTFDKLFAEHDRCETFRRENMQSFVERTRHDIVEWWERCMKSEDERARFITFLLHDFNEDMLKLHEREVDSLKQFYGENEQIFQMVLQRQEIWDRMLALEYKSNDPTRYNNRRGKLLEEEKHGRKFTVYGTQEEELIEEQWMQREESKHQKSSARKKANGVLGKCSSIVSSNRTRLVTGGGSALKASPTPLVMASAIKSGFWLKRKLATPTNSKMHAKPLLLRELNSPAAGVNRTETVKLSYGKVPVVKVYDSKAGGSVAQKRRSRRKSQGKRRSTSVVIISSVESTILQESVCYEKIENYFENNVPNRSSVVLKKQRIRQHQQRMVEPIKPLPSDSSLMEGEENVEPMPHLAPMLPTVPMSFSHSPAAAGSLSMLARSPGVANSTSSGNTTWGD